MVLVSVQLINHLTLHAKGCLRKLDAVQDMLKAQKDQHDNDGASADSGAFDEGELPFRDVEKPKRIIEVVHSKALELEGTINEHLADLTAAADAAQAAKQVLSSVALHLGNSALAEACLVACKSRSLDAQISAAFLSFVSFVAYRHGVLHCLKPEAQFSMPVQCMHRNQPVASADKQLGIAPVESRATVCRMKTNVRRCCVALLCDTQAVAAGQVYAR